MTPTLLVPFPAGVQVEFVYSLGGKVATNRIWLYNILGPSTQEQLDELAPLVTDFWATSLMPALAPDLRLELVRCSSWDDPLAPLVGFTVPLVSGGAASASHSANVSIHVQFRGPINKRFRHAGNFVPGIPVDEVDINTYSPAIRLALFDHYVALIDAARTWGVDEPWYWVVVSLVGSGSLRSEMDFGLCNGPSFLSPYVSPQRHRLRS